MKADTKGVSLLRLARGRLTKVLSGEIGLELPLNHTIVPYKEEKGLPGTVYRPFRR